MRQVKNAYSVLHSRTDVSEVNFIDNKFSRAMKTRYIDVILNGVLVKAMMDTGASRSIMPVSVYERIGKPALCAPATTLRTLSHPLSVRGETTVTVQNLDHSVAFDETFFVANNDRDFVILGSHLLTAVHVAAFVNGRGKERCDDVFFIDEGTLQSVMEVIRSSPQVCTNKKLNPNYLPTIIGYEADIEMMPDATLRYFKPRPVPEGYLKQLDEQLDEMVQQGVLRPYNGAPPWASPVVWALKKGTNERRFCADLSVQLNRYIKNFDYQIPRIENITRKFAGCVVFAKIDLKKAYWQIAVSLKTQALQIVNTHRGPFVVTRLMMGMKNSAALFQRIMEQTIGDVPGVIIYLDDIVVGAPSEAELHTRVGSVVDALTASRFTINYTKSQLKPMRKITFLGMVFENGEYRVDDAHLQKIRDIPRPKNGREVASFLGLVNYFRRFVDRSKCDLSANLEQLKKKRTTFLWTQECEREFLALKRMLVSSPILAMYDPAWPLTLTTDASDTMIGGVLTQPRRGVGPDESAVMYVSRKLLDRETRYGITEKEALAIHYCTNRLRDFLLGRKFKLVTDHQALEYVFHPQSGITKTSNSRLIRWRLALAHFDFDIQYRPGTEITHADAMTRLQTAIRNQHDEDEEIVFAIMGSHDLVPIEFDFVAPPLSNARIQAELRGKHIYRDLMQTIIREDWQHASKAIKVYLKYKDGLAIHNDIIYYGTRPFIPVNMRDEVIKLSHGQHQGSNYLEKAVRVNAWWPDMSESIRDFVRKCHECIKLRGKPAATAKAHQWPRNGVWERLHFDWGQLSDGTLVFVVVDAASNWIHAEICENRSSETVIRVLKALFFDKFRPQLVVSDNAKEFISKRVLLWLNSLGVNRIGTPVYNPESNGPAEKAVQTVKRWLKAYNKDLGIPQDEYLGLCLQYHRLTAKNQLGTTPSQAVYGRQGFAPPMDLSFKAGDRVTYRKPVGAVEKKFDAVVLYSEGNRLVVIADDRPEPIALHVSANSILRLPDPDTRYRGKDEELVRKAVANARGAGEGCNDALPRDAQHESTRDPLEEFGNLNLHNQGPTNAGWSSDSSDNEDFEEVPREYKATRNAVTNAVTIRGYNTGNSAVTRSANHTDLRGNQPSRVTEEEPSSRTNNMFSVCGSNQYTNFDPQQDIPSSSGYSRAGVQPAQPCSPEHLFSPNANSTTLAHDNEPVGLPYNHAEISGIRQARASNKTNSTRGQQVTRRVGGKRGRPGGRGNARIPDVRPGSSVSVASNNCGTEENPDMRQRTVREFTSVAATKQHSNKNKNYITANIEAIKSKSTTTTSNNNTNDTTLVSKIPPPTRIQPKTSRPAAVNSANPNTVQVSPRFLRNGKNVEYASTILETGP